MKSLLIVVALKEEIITLLKCVKISRTVQIETGSLYECYYNNIFFYILITGVGGTNVELNLKPVLKEYNVSTVISIGVSGGITNDVQYGDVVIQEIIYCQKKDTTFSSSKKLIDEFSKLFVNSQNCYKIKNGVTVDQVISTKDEKQKLSTLFPSSLIDMETFYIANLSNEKGIPMISIRLILDNYDELLPDLSTVLNEKGHIQPVNLIKKILKNPVLIIHLIKLGNKMKVLKKNISDLIELVLNHNK